MARRYEKKSINGRMLRLGASIFLPMLALAVFVLLMLLVYNLQYSSVSSNITTASQFSQSFKNDVDLKMYYFVIGSSDELPWDDVRTARNLAQELLERTKNSDSRQSLNSVLNLCDSLNLNIARIQNTEGYDNRIEQLENNIYIITELIEEYIYSYLYYEAGEMAQLQRGLKFWLIVEIVAGVLMTMIIATLSVKSAMKISRSITDPIDALCDRVDEIGRGDLEKKTPVTADDIKLSKLGSGVEEMAVKLSGQIELNRQEQIRLRKIELSLIQAQINPHFLYNTLDTIVWLIETGKDEAAEEMVTSLSSYFRSFLSNGKDIVTVAEEALHVRSYLEIQQVRYKDIIEYSIDIDDGIKGCIIPKMTIQPMVENAIYHGLKPKRGKGMITVKGSLSEGRVILRVEDTGVGMDSGTLEKLRCQIDNDDPSSFALVAAYKRLRLVYGNDCTFTVDSEYGKGTAITMSIPFKTEDNDEENN